MKHLKSIMGITAAAAALVLNMNYAHGGYGLPAQEMFTNETSETTTADDQFIAVQSQEMKLCLGYEYRVTTYYFKDDTRTWWTTETKEFQDYSKSKARKAAEDYKNECLLGSTSEYPIYSFVDTNYSIVSMPATVVVTNCQKATEGVCVPKAGECPSDLTIQYS